MNSQTIVCGLIAMLLINRLLLDEATVVAEAVAMVYAPRSRTQQKTGVNVILVDGNTFP